MFDNAEMLGWVHLIVAVIAGKWAMELGLSQGRQLLWMMAALLFAPLVLLALYVRMIVSRTAGQQGQPA